VLGCAAVCAGLFLVTIKVGSLSLFRIFYALVPGAAAIRAGCRAMIVANLFAVVAIALGCAGARPPLSRHRFGFPASLGLALLALAVVEQINFAPTAQLSRAFDIARLQHVQAAPSSCRSFYVSDERNRQPYEVQIDAMLVALERERPTINDIPACSRWAGICSTPRMPPTSNMWRPGSPAESSRVFVASTSRREPGRLHNDDGATAKIGTASCAGWSGMRFD
jgi:hypothetical protein